MSAFPEVGPLAYLTGQYPRATDTFVQREIAGLRALGIEVFTTSIRRTDASHHVGPEQKAEAETTFCVLENTAKPLVSLRAHASALMRSPGRYVSALRLAARTGAPGLKAFALQMMYFAEAVVLADHLRRNNVRHLHNHIAEASCTVAMLASVLADIPYSFTMHGPGIFFAPERWRIDEKIARAAFTACISHFCRSQGMIYADPQHWGRMHIVHCGVDPALYDRPKAAPAKNLLFVGRLAGVKGVPVLIEALAKLRKSHPDVHLTLVGDGPERADLEALASRSGLSDMVDFAGYKSQAEVAEYLHRADIFVLPSFAEGVPVVLMEALASRTPVVTTRIAGVPELVEDTISGYLVAPGDAEALAARLSDLLDDPDARAWMGEAGRARVVEDYDFGIEAKRLAGLLAAYRGGSPPAEIRAPVPEAS